MRTRRRLLSVAAGTALGLGVVLATASPAWAISSHISPASQGTDSGDAVQWTGTWGGGRPYTVTFVYGDASTNTVLTNTSATSHVFHHLLLVRQHGVPPDAEGCARCQ